MTAIWVDCSVAVCSDSSLTWLLYCSDFGSDYLRCDCHLRWVVQWAESKKVRLARETVCALPSPMQGLMLRRLTADQLHCGKSANWLQISCSVGRQSKKLSAVWTNLLSFWCISSVMKLTLSYQDKRRCILFSFQTSEQSSRGIQFNWPHFF